MKEQLTPNLRLVTFSLHRSLDREENDCDSTLYFLLILLTPTKEFSSLLSTLRSHSMSSRIPRISTSLSFNFFLFFFFWGDSSSGSSDIFGTTFYINESQSWCVKQMHFKIYSLNYRCNFFFLDIGTLISHLDQLWNESIFCNYKHTPDSASRDCLSTFSALSYCRSFNNNSAKSCL